MGRLIKKVNLYIIEVLVQLMDYIISGCLGSTVVALLSFVVLEEMLCSWQIIFFDYIKRARLLHKRYERFLLYLFYFLAKTPSKMLGIFVLKRQKCKAFLKNAIKNVRHFTKIKYPPKHWALPSSPRYVGTVSPYALSNFSLSVGKLRVCLANPENVIFGLLGSILRPLPNLTCFFLQKSFTFGCRCAR